jgi:hypothetical protein
MPFDGGDAGRDPTRFVRGSAVLWRQSGTTVLVLPLGGDDEPLTVSGSAALVWELLDRPVTLGELSAELAGVYNTDSSTIEADLGPVLVRLCEVSAVERAP